MFSTATGRGVAETAAAAGACATGVGGTDGVLDLLHATDTTSVSTARSRGCIATTEGTIPHVPDRLELWQTMLRIRRLEEAVLELAADESRPIRGHVHVSIGQEATAAGA